MQNEPLPKGHIFYWLFIPIHLWLPIIQDYCSLKDQEQYFVVSRYSFPHSPEEFK